MKILAGGDFIYEGAAPTADEIVEKFSEVIGLRVIARPVSGKTESFDWQIEITWADLTDFPRDYYEITAYSSETSPHVVENNGEIVKRVVLDRGDAIEHLLIEGPLAFRHQPKARKRLKEGQFSLVARKTSLFSHEATFMYAVLLTLSQLGGQRFSLDGTPRQRGSYSPDEFRRFPISLEELKARGPYDKSRMLLVDVLMLPILLFIEPADFFSLIRRYIWRYRSNPPKGNPNE